MMKYSNRQLDEIARHLIKDGYFFYRLSFVWGDTPSFRNVRGSAFYFIAGEEILTPRQMHSFLLHSWKPTGQEEIMFLKNRLAAHFAALPKDVPEWSGPSLHEMLGGAPVAAPAMAMAMQPREREQPVETREEVYAFGGGSRAH